jgi:hypothetical protein
MSGADGDFLQQLKGNGGREQKTEGRGEIGKKVGEKAEANVFFCAARQVQA